MDINCSNQDSKIDISRLSKQVSLLVKDLEQVVTQDAQRKSAIQEAWQDAKAHERTSASLTEWREEYLTQVAVAWVLTLVFVRYLEDHDLIDPVLFGELAQQHQRAYFQQDAHKVDSDTDYLLHIIATLAQPTAGQLFSPALNPLHKLPISAIAATQLIRHFREADTETGTPILDLRDRDTRFLGDLYQDLSEDIRDKYALWQTPDFVESFILDMTLEPAIETFGLDQVRFIDPTCGSGHFVLGGFKRLFAHKRAARPRERADVLVREALEASFGVDINPFAVAIARFRLLLEAFNLCNVTRWDDPHDWPLNLAVGDSLILGKHFPRFETSTTKFQLQGELDRHRWSHLYSTEDNDLIFGSQDRNGILMQQYHAVVGNPPYITVKDAGPREAYKKHYASCHGKYSLVTPFYERFFELAIGAALNDKQDQFQLGNKDKSEAGAGFVGMIVGNAFMKRSFGKKLIETIIPHTDLTHVIDLAGAYIPGHSPLTGETPTAILFGRNQEPEFKTVRAILGICSEPSRPNVLSKGLVWSSIIKHVNHVGFSSEFITTRDVNRQIFERHPWNLQGGDIFECKELITTNANSKISHLGTVGIIGMSNVDDVYLQKNSFFKRFEFPENHYNRIVLGEDARDWRNSEESFTYLPYTSNWDLDKINPKTNQTYWPFRELMWSRATFAGGTYKTDGRTWYEWHQLTTSRLQTPLIINYAFVATHNHFILGRGKLVFNRTSPVIKLNTDATLDDHIGLIGLLNSSSFALWARTTFFQKGGASEPWEDRLEYDCTKMKKAPIPSKRPLTLARKLDELAQQMNELEPSAIAAHEAPVAHTLETAKDAQTYLLGLMMALQEELDWHCYELYKIIENGQAPLITESQLNSTPSVSLGQRAFEIVLRCQVEDVKRLCYNG